MSGSRRQAPEAMKKTAQNMFTICGHLQNPDLYSTSWADAASICDQSGLVATRDVEKGEIMSLIPVHAVGLKGLGRTKKHDVLFFNDDLDGHFFRTSKRSAYQGHLPETELFDNKLFIDISPGHPNLSGWIGHLVSTNDVYANCKIVPLVPPICALVSTTSTAIVKGRVLFQNGSRISTKNLPYFLFPGPPKCTSLTPGGDGTPRRNVQISDRMRDKSHDFSSLESQNWVVSNTEIDAP